VKCPATQEVERGTPEEQMNEETYISKILSKMPEERNLGTLAYKNHCKLENQAKNYK
jgi:hypothetical protein